MNQLNKLSKKRKAKYISRIVLYPFMLLFSKLGRICKLFRTTKHQIMAGALCVAMVFTMLPAMSQTAYTSDSTPLTFTALVTGSSVTLDYESGSN